MKYLSWLQGSVGAMLYGEPRMTHDMDVVVEIPIDKADALAHKFSSDEFYFPPVEAIQDDIRRRGQFNILHVESDSKVDLIIIAKLRYYDEGCSEKHIRDIRGMLRISGDDIDHDYVAKWVEKLGFAEHWKLCV